MSTAYRIRKRDAVNMAIMAIKDVAMRTANIAELRDRLTQFLREVRAGEEIIVRDRKRPIAKIVPPTTGSVRIAV